MMKYTFGFPWQRATYTLNENDLTFDYKDKFGDEITDKIELKDISKEYAHARVKDDGRRILYATPGLIVFVASIFFIWIPISEYSERLLYWCLLLNFLLIVVPMFFARKTNVLYFKNKDGAILASIHDRNRKTEDMVEFTKAIFEKIKAQPGGI